MAVEVLRPFISFCTCSCETFVVALCGVHFPMYFQSAFEWECCHTGFTGEVEWGIVINFWALLPHMYGDINKLSQCFVELVFFYFLFAHNIYSKLQHCFSIFKPLQCRALQDISQFSQCKPKCLNTAQVACPQHWSRMSGRRAQYVGGLCIYSIKVGLFII